MVSQETQDKLKEIRSSFRLLMNGPVSQSMRAIDGTKTYVDRVWQGL